MKSIAFKYLNIMILFHENKFLCKFINVENFPMTQNPDNKGKNDKQNPNKVKIHVFKKEIHTCNVRKYLQEILHTHTQS